MNRFLFFIPFLLFLSVNLLAQAPDTMWTKTFGGVEDDRGNSVQQTTDEGYIITGSYNEEDFLIKTDENGDTLWCQIYEGYWSRNWGYSVQQTTDGGYIIVGERRIESRSTFSKKTDENGNEVWINFWMGAFDGDVLAYSVQQTTDEGYIFTGVNTFVGGLWWVKTDTIGETLWTNNFTDGGYGYSVKQTADSGYVIAGRDSYYPWEADACLIKTDEDGETLWTKRYGGFADEEGYSVLQTTGGGYIIVGSTESFGAGGKDIWLIKTDENGDTLWTRTYGGVDDEEGFSICAAPDGGYVIVGYTNSFGSGSEDVWIIRTDENGDTLWTKTLGGVESDVGKSIQQTTDGGYIVAGYTSSFGAGGEDVWLIKIKPDTITTAGNIIRVPEDYPTIQAGINAAQDGDTVLVAEDTYYENINFKGKAITVASHFILDGLESHIENTVINGSQPTNLDSGSVVMFVNGEDSTSLFCGFTITGGTGNYYPVFDVRAGGGISIWLSGAKICNNIIEYNSVTYATALAMGSGILAYSPGRIVIIRNNIIRNNSVTGEYPMGGGISLVQNGVTYILSNIIIDNEAIGSNASGGGIDVYESYDEQIIKNNYIKGNTTAQANLYGGGGIGLYNWGGPVLVTNNLIVDNSGYKGGGVLVDYNVDVSSKTATLNFGDFSVTKEESKSSELLQDIPVLVNNTIYYNSAEIGGGIHCEGFAPDVMNSIVWGNTFTTGGQISGTATVSYSDVEGGYTGIGNIDEHPLFIMGSEFYLLSGSSPCIDFGNPDAQYNDVEDPSSPGNPMPPALGTLRNDMGHCGGPASLWGFWDWPIPVELTSFTASSQAGKVTLNWTTATEINNLGFEIERKIINNENQGEWVRIGFTEGHGTTIEPKEYSYVDDISSITASSLAYRLKQLDFDGSYEYSDEVLVEMLVPKDFALEQNYPNPFNPSTTITFGVPVKARVILKVFNSLGEEVAQLVNEEKPAGSYQIKFDATILSSGVYFYQLKAGSFVETKKMILLR